VTWRLLESGRLGDLPLALYQRDGEFMVRVDGLELMSSRHHLSEEALAHLARAALRAPRPRILLAGLGLGYTLAAFLREFGARCRLEVVEKSADLLRWYRAHYRDRVLAGADDAAVGFHLADVHDHLAAQAGPWDAVVLDVDNGPEPVCGEENRRLYAAPGLALIRRRLAPGGALLLWSGFESAPFAERARAAGFWVSSHPVPLPREGLSHHLYLCALPA